MKFFKYFHLQHLLLAEINQNSTVSMDKKLIILKLTGFKPYQALF
jgi:hypothetical protein